MIFKKKTEKEKIIDALKLLKDKVKVKWYESPLFYGFKCQLFYDNELISEYDYMKNIWIFRNRGSNNAKH